MRFGRSASSIGKRYIKTEIQLKRFKVLEETAGLPIRERALRLGLNPKSERWKPRFRKLLNEYDRHKEIQAAIKRFMSKPTCLAERVSGEKVRADNPDNNGSV